MIASNQPADDVEALKLVPADMLDRLPTYAGEVLGLNERLARYVQFVASLERQNQARPARSSRPRCLQPPSLCGRIVQQPPPPQSLLCPLVSPPIAACDRI